jgi:hypothetical protein
MAHLCAKCSEVHNGDQRRCGDQHNAPPPLVQPASGLSQAKQATTLPCQHSERSHLSEPTSRLLCHWINNSPQHAKLVARPSERGAVLMESTRVTD